VPDSFFIFNGFAYYVGTLKNNFVKINFFLALIS